MNLDLFKQWLILNCEEKNTVDTYYNQVNKIFLQLGEPLTQESINKYFTNLIELKKSTSTINIRINSLRKYLIFTKQTFELPKERSIDKRVNKYFTQEQLQKDVIPYLSQIFKYNYEQVEVILKVLFLTGIRREEIINLKRKNIDLIKNEIELLNTKGNKDRLVPIDKILSNQLKNYFESCPEENNAFNITLMKINYIFSKINKELFFDIPLTPKLCRHSCAIHLIRKGLDISHVKEILGHKDIKTTMIYAESNFELVKEVYKNKIKGF